MKPIQWVLVIGAAGAVLGCFVTLPAFAENVVSHTLSDVRQAYADESRAAARYINCAEKADTEGYPGLAALFRAASASETVHANNHAVTVKKLGGVPVFDAIEAECASAIQGAKDAARKESEEVTGYYADRLKRARAEHLFESVRTLEYALKTEAQHARLFEEAVQNPEGWPRNAREFHVCPVCGFTVEEAESPRCPSCKKETANYMTVE